MELGYCYWREGAFKEARDLLEAALDLLGNTSSDIKAVTLLRIALVEVVSNRLNDALRLHVEAAPLFAGSINDSIKGRFHNEYGTVLKNLGRAEKRNDYIDRALIEYAAASYHFEQAGNSRYQACVENNLGFLYGTIKRFADAHEHLDRAQALFTSLKDKAHIAQVDDTRARVLLEENRVAEAAKFANAAVQALDGGDQQALLAEALTTQGIALARLGLYKAGGVALQRAVEVAQVAGDLEDAGLAELSIIEELGPHLTLDEISVTYDRALDLLSGSRNPATKERLLNCAQRVLYLSGIIPTPPSWENFHLKDALRRYEARIIERALKDAGRSVTRAARILGFRNHTSLIKKLNTWHEDLLSERAPIRQRRQSLMFLNASEETGPRPIAILHVEDNLLVADAVKATLELEGWIVETVRDGATAARLLESDVPFDAVILDNDLPGITGLDLINHLRCLAHRQNIPLIMLTASDVEKEARQQGVNAFLKKPDDVMVVTETIARLLARKVKAK
jgi:CheY-like chemotaxis protein/tetratricopeptide (TPR) repeat protein